MFYLKHKGKKQEIEEDNVYTLCPRCGCEHVVDLSAIATPLSGLDLYGTSVYCAECSAERANK